MEFYSIGELCSITKGSTGIMKAVPGPYPLVTTGPDRKSSSEYDFDDEAVCIPLVSSTGHGHKSLNYIHYQSGKFALGTILAAVIPKDKSVLSAEYLQRYLFFFKDQLVVSLMKGAANVSLAVKDIAKIQVPVPPISKQVEFIELFNKAENGKQSLLHENQKQASYLTKLRQAILQEAIEGKLTADWRKENPIRKGDPNYDAKALLEKIQSEKEKLIKEGKIKKQKPLAPIKADEVPFELPNGWAWCQLSQILANTKYALKAGPFGSSLTKSEYKKNGYKVYGQEQVISQDPFCGNYFIDNQKFEQLKSCAISPGDILISLVGTIGKILILPEDVKPGVINPRLIKITLHSSIFKNYFTMLYSSGCIQSQLKENASGQTMDVISIKILSKVMFPLPPFAEQQAIVDRVEKHLFMLDELEKQVSERKEQSEQLMQAVLREAFEGGK
jgi:type I restriction enzyme S subunit